MPTARFGSSQPAICAATTVICGSSCRRYNLSLAVGAEALIGYETVNRGRRTLEDGATLRNRNAFLYGGAIAAEVSVYFSDRTIFLLSVQQRALAGSTLATFHTFLSLGVRFIIN